MIHSTNLAGVRYLLHVSSAIGLPFGSQYSEVFMINLYSWLCLSELATPSMQKFLIFLVHAQHYQGFLYLGYSGLYLGDYYVCSTSEILLQILYQGQHHAMQGFILCYEFQHYEFLWISSALVHSLIEVLLIISPSQLTLYYSEWVGLLNF